MHALTASGEEVSTHVALAQTLSMDSAAKQEDAALQLALARSREEHAQATCKSNPDTHPRESGGVITEPC